VDVLIQPSEEFREVLGSPLPVFLTRDWRLESGRGLPQSKTLARQPNNQFNLAATVFLKSL